MKREIDCPRCGIESRVKKRDFSDQALAALVTWGELESEMIDEPICKDCYAELRDILIERSDDVIDISEFDVSKAG